MSCEKFIGKLFLARDVAHSVHLSTRSYAKHMALRSFYGDIVGLADQFAEAYQGKHGLIGPIVRMTTPKSDNIIKFLQDQAEDLEKTRYEVVERDCTPLQNLIDEILALYYSTTYKLKFLA
jgi:chloramphenicol O-acetyltransferase